MMARILMGATAACLVACVVLGTFLHNSLQKLATERARTAVLMETNDSLNATVNNMVKERALLEELSAKHQARSAKAEATLKTVKRKLEDERQQNAELASYLSSFVPSTVVGFLLGVPGSQGDTGREVETAEAVSGANPSTEIAYTTSHSELFDWVAQYIIQLDKCNSDKEAVRVWADSQ